MLFNIAAYGSLMKEIADLAFFGTERRDLIRDAHALAKYAIFLREGIFNADPQCNPHTNQPDKIHQTRRNSTKF